jgi:Na+-translocating ferredoxin:NAD+ oxidoreductase RnfG subunit
MKHTLKFSIFTLLSTLMVACSSETSEEKIQRAENMMACFSPLNDQT